jgi:hypothetical protein
LADEGSQLTQAEPDYNTVFERLVKADDDIEGFIAYGLYKLAKREWNLSLRAKTGAAPSSQQLADYHQVWTNTALQALRDNAENALYAYAQDVMAVERPDIEAEALKAGRPIWKDVLIAVASAFTYSLLLLLAALIIRYIGVDLVEVARGGKHEPPPAAAPATIASPQNPS